MRIVSSALKIFIIADLGSPCFKIRQFGNSPNCSSFTNSAFFFHFYYAPVCLAKFINTVRKQLTKTKTLTVSFCVQLLNYKTAKNKNARILTSPEDKC